MNRTSLTVAVMLVFGVVPMAQSHSGSGVYSHGWLTHVRQHTELFFADFHFAPDIELTTLLIIGVVAAACMIRRYQIRARLGSSGRELAGSGLTLRKLWISALG